MAAPLAAAEAAEAELQVTGEVRTATPRLSVAVTVSNSGGRATGGLDIVGELLGQRVGARLPAGIAPGGRGVAALDFDPAGARPGVHVLALLLEHPVEGAPDGAGNPPLASRRAWLLVALGASTEPAVRLTPQPLRIDVSGALPVLLESTDGVAHRVSLRAWTARGLRAEGDPVELEVPSQAAAHAALPLVRAGAARGTRHAVLLVAETLGDGQVRSSVATATVEVSADPSLLPRWRRAILALAVGLLTLALGVELWGRMRRRDRIA